MENCNGYEKYLFLVNDTVIAIEAENKVKAIEIFKNEFEILFSKDWAIKRLITEVTINGDTNRY